MSQLEELLPAKIPHLTPGECSMHIENIATKLFIITCIIGLCLSSVPAAAQTLPGIIHYWSADGDATDSIGGNNGTLYYGATYGPSPVGQAFDLTGSGDLVAMDHPVQFADGEDFTVSFWMKMVAPSPIYGALLDTRKADFYGFVLTVYPSGVIDLNGRCDNANYDFGGLSAATTQGEWHHVAAAFDWTTDTAILYVDGIPYPSSLAACNGFLNSNHLYLGALSTLNPSYDFNGLVDEVQIYNRALSGSEILILFNESPVPVDNTTWGCIKNLYR
jgi:hypothetical protein